MAIKMQPKIGDIKSFISDLDDSLQKKDSLKLIELFEKIMNEEGRFWGPGMIGYGQYHYKYPSGREGDWFLTGFAPRKGKLSLYVLAGFEDFPELMKKLGKYKIGKSCLYVNNLDDIDLDVFEELVIASNKAMKEKYPD